MALSIDPRSAQMAAALTFLFVSAALGESASIYSMQQLEAWAENSLMALSLQMPGGGPLQTYQVLPLTSSLGLNQTSLTRTVCWLAASTFWLASPAGPATTDANLPLVHQYSGEHGRGRREQLRQTDRH